MKILAGIILVATVALFAGKPTGSEVLNVMDYYNSGDEAVVVETKLCLDIIKSGENKNNCGAEAAAATIKKGEKVMLWMNLMVPKNQNLALSTQFLKKGRSIKTKESKVSGSLRYRTWVTIPTNKSGKISVTIDQEKGEDFVNLKTLEYTVVD